MATDLMRDHMQKLAVVEATQSIELLFTLIDEMILLLIRITVSVCFNQHVYCRY